MSGKRVSAAVHVVLLAIAIPATLAFAIVGQERDNLSRSLAPFVFVPALVAWVVWVTLIYKMWDSLRGEGTISPGLAVALAAIPGLSVFGFPFSLLRFPGAFNATMNRRNLASPRLGIGAPIGLVLLAAVLPALATLAASMGSDYDTRTLRTVVALAVFAGALAFYLVQLRFVAKLCGAINAARDSTPATGRSA